MIGLAPGVTTTFAGLDLEAAARGRVASDCLAQHRQAERRRVVGPAVVERLLGGLADVDRGVEIGLADLQVDDVVALGFPGASLGRSLESGLGADTDHALRKFHGAMLAAVLTDANRPIWRRLLHLDHDDARPSGRPLRSSTCPLE